jgi:hypothetical protein
MEMEHNTGIGERDRSERERVKVNGLVHLPYKETPQRVTFECV